MPGTGGETSPTRRLVEDGPDGIGPGAWAGAEGLTLGDADGMVEGDGETDGRAAGELGVALAGGVPSEVAP